MIGWITLLSKGLSRVFSNTTVQKHQFFGTQPSLWSNSYIHTTLHHTGKTIALTRQTFVGKVMSLLFNMLPRRQWQPTPVLLPGKFHGRRSLEGCSPWGHEESDTTERLHCHFSLFTFMHWRRKWQPTPVFLPGESQGWGSLVGCHLWGRTESDTTEVT